MNASTSAFSLVESRYNMVAYYGVTSVERIGTNLHHTEERVPLVGSNNRVVAVLNNGAWKIATDVTEQSTWNDFLAQYDAGHWLSFEVYELTTDQLIQCPDEGRVSVVQESDIVERSSEIPGIVAIYRADDGSELIFRSDVPVMPGDLLFRPVDGDPYSVRVGTFGGIGPEQFLLFDDPATGKQRIASGTEEELDLEGSLYRKVIAQVP